MTKPKRAARPPSPIVLAFLSRIDGAAQQTGLSRTDISRLLWGEDEGRTADEIETGAYQPDISEMDLSDAALVRLLGERGMRTEVSDGDLPVATGTCFGGEPALYDRMCMAIAECARVDEAKDIRDKAMALEAYYRQARNLDAEREAANVRLRAERRVGELLRELTRAETPNPSGRNQHEVTSDDRTQPIASPYAAALHDQGISRQAASRFQALAAVPTPEFERALAGPEKPSAAGVIRAAKPTVAPTVNDDGLWVWGRLRDFENGPYFDGDKASLLGGMTNAMRSDVARITPRLIDFLSELETTNGAA